MSIALKASLSVKNSIKVRFWQLKRLGLDTTVFMATASFPRRD